MLKQLPPPSPRRDSFATALWRLLLRFVTSHPYISFFLIVFVSNAFGSAFNIVYNVELIVNRYLDERQAIIFHQIALPIYNLIAYPLGLAVTVRYLIPLIKCRQKLLNN